MIPYSLIKPVNVNQDGSLVKKNIIKKIGLKEKILLMGLQILLPFVLYVALKAGSEPLGLTIGVLMALSMLVLILMG